MTSRDESAERSGNVAYHHVSSVCVVLCFAFTIIEAHQFLYAPEPEDREETVTWAGKRGE